MKVTGSTIQQIEKDKPKSKCRKWRLWATTDQGRKSERFTGTYTKAQERLKAWVAELEETVPNSETFGAYAESWRLWRMETGRYSPNTVLEDARKVRALRRTALDGMRMDDIGPDDCRAALTWLRRNPVRGEEYTNTSMTKFHGTLYSALQQAVDDGKLARNPMASVTPPKVDTPERDALSPNELGLLLNRLDQEPMDGRVMAVYLMACLALRRGEACALLDADVADVARVRFSVRAADGSVGPTKSRAGERVIPVTPRLQAKIAQWRDMRRRLGWTDLPQLCCNTNGDLLAPNVLGSWWCGSARSRGFRDGIGCQGMSLHQLRHSNLSMMARHMSAFDLQRYAGWSTIDPALVYVHDDLDAVSRAVSEAWGDIERTKNAPTTIK